MKSLLISCGVVCLFGGTVRAAMVRSNEAFTVTFVTNQYTEAVRLFNESGVGLMPSACTYVDSGSNRIWSYTVAVGTSGQRFFTAKAAAADRVYVGDAFVNLFVG